MAAAFCLPYQNQTGNILVNYQEMSPSAEACKKSVFDHVEIEIKFVPTSETYLHI
jgi:hypothetical protein